MEDKKEKKGFWASLFAPKPCSCSCGMQIVEEFDVATGNANPSKENDSNHAETTESDSCDDSLRNCCQ